MSSLTVLTVVITGAPLVVATAMLGRALLTILRHFRSRAGLMPAVVAAAVDELMGDGPHRAAAARLGAAIRASSGAGAGAALIESVVARRAAA